MYRQSVTKLSRISITKGPNTAQLLFEITRVLCLIARLGRYLILSGISADIVYLERTVKLGRKLISHALKTGLTIEIFK